ncbi:MAG: hypothetical protein GYB64_14335 [Chloroflexi bacterium]|nr:hypothetical protein [Chloroflexota bacterium]
MMDDDLRALLGDDSDDEDLFSAFDDPSTTSGRAARDDLLGMTDDRPDWVDTVPAAPPQPEQAPRSGRQNKPRRRRSGSGFLGMTPFQRMVLSIFLFLDVSVIGFMLLIALGKIQF